MSHQTRKVESTSSFQKILFQWCCLFPFFFGKKKKYFTKTKKISQQLFFSVPEIKKKFVAKQKIATFGVDKENLHHLF